MGIASFILSLAAWILSLIPVLGPLAAILALILGLVGRSDPDHDYPGLAIAGIVISSIYLILALVGLCTGIALIGTL